MCTHGTDENSDKPMIEFSDSGDGDVPYAEDDLIMVFITSMCALCSATCTCSVCIIHVDDYQVSSINNSSGTLQNDDDPEVLAEGICDRYPGLSFVYIILLIL